MTTGEAVDFGHAAERSLYRAPMQSPTRAVLAGGYGNRGTGTTWGPGIISFIMASKGNSVYWGDTTAGEHDQCNGASNSVRGVYNLGAIAASPYNSSNGALDMHTLASGGNSISFGELVIPVGRPAASASQIRVVIAGGWNRPDDSSVKQTLIQSILVASEGGAVSFGDLTVARDQFGGTSDCHG